MSITRARFEFIKEKYGLHASWAIWPDAGDTPKSNMDDLSIFDDDEIIFKLNPNIILVGLNFSKSDVISKPFQNFHGSGGGAYKIRYALMPSPLSGAYMTDIIKDFPEEESKNVMRHLRANQPLVVENIIKFRQELSDVGACNPTIIAFGGDAFEILSRNIGNSFKILKVMHYSHYISKEKYKEAFEKIIAKTITVTRSPQD